MLFINVLFADVITLTSDQEVSSTIAQGEIVHYKIAASNGNTVNIVLNGLSDDADLHVRIGAIAKGGTYDCKSTNGGTTADSCSVTLTSNNDVYIRIYGYRATNYTVKATIENAAGEGVLNISDAVTLRETKFYTVPALQGQTLEALLDGLNADADLYLRVGAEPTGSEYDCKSSNGGTTADSCSVTLTQDDTVHIAVYGYRATNYTLTASLNEGATPTLTSGHAVSGSVARSAIKYYKINSSYGDKVIATISDLTADADIYIKKGEKPTASSFDCKSTNGGTEADSCSIDILENTEVYIGVSGFRAANYNLLVTSEREMIPANPQIPTVLEDAEGGTLNPNWVTVRGDKPAYI